MQRDKQVVYEVSSDMLTGVDQLLFMPDPHSRDYTIVRYISTVEMNSWKKALQPMVSGPCGAHGVSYLCVHMDHVQLCVRRGQGGGG